MHCESGGGETVILSHCSMVCMLLTLHSPLCHGISSLVSHSSATFGTLEAAAYSFSVLRVTPGKDRDFLQTGVLEEAQCRGEKVDTARMELHLP